MGCSKFATLDFVEIGDKGEIDNTFKFIYMRFIINCENVYIGPKTSLRF